MFGRKTKRIQELEERLAQGEQQYLQLQSLLESVGGGEALAINAAVAELKRQRDRAERDFEASRHEMDRQYFESQQRIEASSREMARLDAEIQVKKNELSVLGYRLDEATVLGASGFSGYEHPARSSVALAEELASVRARIKEMIRLKEAVDATTTFSFNNSAAKGRKFVSDMSQMMLRAYNAEAENCVLTVKAGNGETARKRLDRARDQVRKLGSLIDLKINIEYHQLRQRELALSLEHQNAKKAEKEAEREERARLREEKKAQQELEAKRKELDKQRLHYVTVLKTLEEQGRAEEAEEILERLRSIDTEIEKVDFRAANIRAGYVYVISNLGAFGPNMVKIGMTRRLDPMDRVRELGDASVPFGFDVHALFFSEDAVGVEAELHRRFAAKRVNQINLRREFFHATPGEVRDQLVHIAGNLLEFTEEAEAEQYRLSLAQAEGKAV